MSEKLYVLLVALTGTLATMVNEIFKFLNVPWLSVGIGVTGAVATCITTVLAIVKEYQNKKANKSA